MCLIIRQPATDRLTDDEVVDIWRRNSDGFGAAWLDAKTGKVQTWRTVPSSAQAAIDAYSWFSGVVVDVALHWRMATHGRVTTALAHPFRVDGETALLHNGILPAWAPVDRGGGESDTSRFARHLGTVDRSSRDAVVDHAAASSGSVIVTITPEGIRWSGREIRHNGRIYSNTYAWSAPRGLGWASWSGSVVDDDDDVDDGATWQAADEAIESGLIAWLDPDSQDAFWEAYTDGDAARVATVLDEVGQ